MTYYNFRHSGIFLIFGNIDEEFVVSFTYIDSLPLVKAKVGMESIHPADCTLILEFEGCKDLQGFLENNLILDLLVFRFLHPQAYQDYN